MHLMERKRERERDRELEKGERETKNYLSFHPTYNHYNFISQFVNNISRSEKCIIFNTELDATSTIFLKEKTNIGLA